jgi:membrane fusion protein, macrolide-specific efflux system
MRARLARLAHRPLVVAAAVVVVLALGGGTYLLVSSNDPKSAASYRLVTASSGTIKQSVSSTGTIEPAEQDELNFAVSGEVTSVRVAEGDKVNAGDVLATVDSAELNASLAQAKAALASDQAKLTSDQDASASDTQLAADQAAVTTASDQVSAAHAALDEATLTSPIKGVVATVNLSVGQHVASASGSGSNGSGSDSGAGGNGAAASSGGAGGSGQSDSSASGSSTTQFLVISTDSWIVNATVDSSGVGLIAKGDQATIVPGSGTGSGSGGGAGLGRLGRGASAAPSGTGGTGSTGGSATSGTTVYGTISSIGLIATNSSGTASFPVVVKVTGSPSGLHAGDTATVSLIYRQYTNVLTVPSLAVSQVDGKSVVYEISSGKKVAHTVITGVSSGGLTQIKSGLNEGDQVVIATSGTGGSGGGFPTGRFPGGLGGAGGGGGGARIGGGGRG